MAKLVIACTECLNRNYHFNKSKLVNKPPLAIKKFCAHCKRHTLHRSTR